MPRDVGFTSAVFGRLQLQVRHGPPPPVCPVSAPLGLAPSWCRGATPGVQKAQHTGDHQQTKLCWAGCCQIPLHQRSGRHSGCRRSGQLQHSINGTWPGAAALAMGDSCSEGTKTQLSSSRGCAHLAPSPSHYFLPLSTLKKPSRGTPTSPSITPGLAMRTCPHHLPSSRLLPAVPRQRATPRVGLCNAPVLPLLHMGELAAS